MSLSQTLVGVIGDYQFAAEHINNLEDEVNLAEIALQ